MNYTNYQEYVYYAAVNIALEIPCAILLFVIAMRLRFGWNTKTRLERLFARILFVHVLTLVLDAFTWIFDMVTEPDMRPAMVIGNFLVFTLTFANFYLLMDYIISSAVQKQAIHRWVLRVVAIGCLMGEVLLIASQFTGILYTVDEGNRYTISAGLTGIYIFFAALICFIACVLLYYRNSFRRSDFRTLFAYMAILFSAMPAQIMFPDLMLCYFIPTIALMMIYVNIHLKHEKRMKEQALELADAHASIMLSQIQPHFLYNTLSVVASLCTTDPEGAEEAIVELSRYLRGNLANMAQKEPIPFEEEMMHVRTYFSLEKKRFGDRIQAIYETDVSDFRLPALTLQPIVENSVRHGITAREGTGTIRIKTEQAWDFIKITIEDDGVGFEASKKPSEDRPHIGIDNVRFRVENMCAGMVDIESEPGRGTRVVIRIPDRSGARW